MSLDCREFVSVDKNTTLKCWFFVESAAPNVIWLKANDIAGFMNYATVDQFVNDNVPGRWIRSFGSLITQSVISNTDLRVTTLFINELGAYTLLSRRTGDQTVIEFTEWLNREIYGMKTRHLTLSSPNDKRGLVTQRDIDAIRCNADEARCDAAEARLLAENTRIDILALSHRFGHTVSNSCDIADHYPADVTPTNRINDDFEKRSNANSKWAIDTLERLSRKLVNH